MDINTRLTRAINKTATQIKLHPHHVKWLNQISRRMDKMKYAETERKLTNLALILEVGPPSTHAYPARTHAGNMLKSAKTNITTANTWVGQGDMMSMMFSDAADHLQVGILIAKKHGKRAANIFANMDTASCENIDGKTFRYLDSLISYR